MSAAGIFSLRELYAIIKTLRHGYYIIGSTATKVISIFMKCNEMYRTVTQHQKEKFLKNKAINF